MFAWRADEGERTVSTTRTSGANGLRVGVGAHCEAVGAGCLIDEPSHSPTVAEGSFRLQTTPPSSWVKTSPDSQRGPATTTSCRVSPLPSLLGAIDIGW